MSLEPFNAGLSDRRLAVLSLALFAYAPNGLLAGNQAETQGSGSPSSTLPPALVEVADVERATVESRLEATGTLRAPEALMLKSRGRGRVAELGFREGQSVSTGDTLLRLERDRAEAAVREAAATLSQAENAEARLQELGGQDFVSTQELEQAAATAAQAAALGVSLADIGRSLQILMGGEDITDFAIDAETYEVMVRAREADRAVPRDLGRAEVRADDGTLVRLSGLIDTELVGRAAERLRIDRRAAVTLKASLAGGAALGDVLDALEARAKPLLPADVEIRWLAVSQDYQRSGRTFLLAFALALGIVYLVLAAQFESFVQPLVLLAGAPLALLGSRLPILGPRSGSAAVRSTSMRKSGSSWPSD